jgi:hypothetical protein
MIKGHSRCPWRPVSEPDVAAPALREQRVRCGLGHAEQMVTRARNAVRGDVTPVFHPGITRVRGMVVHRHGEGDRGMGNRAPGRSACRIREDLRECLTTTRSPALRGLCAKCFRGFNTAATLGGGLPARRGWPKRLNRKSRLWLTKPLTTLCGSSDNVAIAILAVPNRQNDPVTIKLTHYPPCRPA